MELLLTLLGVFVGVMAALLLTVIVVFLLTRRSLKRRNRLSPNQSEDAPISWLYSPAGPARLHRRLRSAVAVAQMISARHAGDRTPPRTAELATELEREALAIDRHLSVVSRLAPRERKPLMRRLNADVMRIEQLASRLSMHDAETSAAPALANRPSAIEELAEELDRLEAARRELGEVDAAAGIATEAPLKPPATSPRRTRGRS